MWPLIILAGALFILSRDDRRERAVADVLAPQVATDIAEHGTEYDRDLVSAFQEAASIPVDGLYGDHTRAALQFHGVTDPPPAIYGRAA